MKYIIYIIILIGLSSSIALSQKVNKKMYTKDLLRIEVNLSFSTDFPAVYIALGLASHFYVSPQNSLGLELGITPYPIDITYYYRRGLSDNVSDYSSLRMFFTFTHKWHLGQRRKRIFQRTWYFKQQFRLEHFSQKHATTYNPYLTSDNNFDLSLNTNYDPSNKLLLGAPKYLYENFLSLGLGFGRDININKTIGLNIEFNLGVAFYSFNNRAWGGTGVYEMEKEFNYSKIVYIQLRFGFFFRVPDKKWAKKY